MRLTSEARLRMECWETIGGRTRERLHELAGNVIDWFARVDASSPDGRSYAVVLGDRGLSIAEPRVDTAHRPVYVISAFVFDPASLRHVRVDHRPPPTAHTTSGPAAGAGPDLGLSQDARGLLGNLPPRAQHLLQAPFAAGQRILQCHWAYEGFDHHLDMFMVCLAGPRNVTAATGTKIIPAGHSPETAHWSLTCHQASVVRRIGR
ncbi:hypothetical protein DPM19_22970 [Actinomadura craniellae]|uniref:Uncharacterized protein n=2 Tax=Actinomadura craniellae TaxID=2231787 RepID=A0A365H1C5_9ACTN|nr:hypothetical protein DPM19_22970 [Actinomadura craniellae]